LKVRLYFHLGGRVVHYHHHLHQLSNLT
jgi:hypothetical protein